MLHYFVAQPKIYSLITQCYLNNLVTFLPVAFIQSIRTIITSELRRMRQKSEESRPIFGCLCLKNKVSKIKTKIKSRKGKEIYRYDLKKQNKTQNHSQLFVSSWVTNYQQLCVSLEKMSRSLFPFR